MSNVLKQTNVQSGPYPERPPVAPSKLDDLARRTLGKVTRWQQSHLRRWSRLPGLLHGYDSKNREAGGERIRYEADELRLLLRREGLRPGIIARAFSLVREVARRTMGQRHYDVQIIGGWVLLSGMLAEMETGEGKTLTATLPACTMALAGWPVHIVTVNDYLAKRDASLMRPIYEALGLRVGLIVPGMEPKARRDAYAADVTYCTNKELVFDYLKDRLALGGQSGRLQLTLERLYRDQPRIDQLVLRGLYYAIVDEADSVLVDEARTPLIIAGQESTKEQQDLYREALALSKQLGFEDDFIIDAAARTVRLTRTGQSRIADNVAKLGGYWKGRRRREALVCQALTAQHLFIRDTHYLVKEDKIQIIDEYTGRVMADRSWEGGLHQMIEVKEGVAATERQVTLARISYQRFFRRYLRLSGMTGTAREITNELWHVYQLPVVSIPTNRPVERRGFPTKVFGTLNDKWHAIVERVRTIHQTGRPILVGTRSVAASQHLSELLSLAGLPHQVLNAMQDEDEAEVIRQAGEPGRITVATNMAGRGTDIQLASGVAEIGGLHVIATECHEAGRVDRQLFGRCGRQGDAGSYEMVLSLEDELIQTHGPRITSGFVRVMGTEMGSGLRGRLALSLFAFAQYRAERRHAAIRHQLLKSDDRLESTLAFSGKME